MEDYKLGKFLVGQACILKRTLEYCSLKMGVFRNWQRNQYMLHMLIIQLIGWLGWFSSIALAQTELSETVTGSLNFPDIGLACLANIAIFVTSLLRGRLDLEMGARDLLATLRVPKLKYIHGGYGLTTCDDYQKASVVILSNHTPNNSVRQFMKYVSNAYNVHSILLQCFPRNAKFCNWRTATCQCIVFCTVDEVAILLVRRMPKTLKRLCDYWFLLPSLECLKNGCHGCNKGLLYVERGGNTLIDGGYAGASELETKTLPVSDIFIRNFQEEEHACMCIPLVDTSGQDLTEQSSQDYWTKLLTRSFQVGVRDDDLEKYYSTASLVVPRLAEILVNLVLTAWFRVDGFSSSLMARRATKDHVVDTKGSGFAANVFLTKALTKKLPPNTYQVLVFRGTILGMRTFSFIVGCVNLICSISWVVFIGFEGRAGKWYDKHSIPPSKSRAVVIMVGIGIALGMDFLHLYLARFRPSKPFHQRVIVWLVIILEIGAITGVFFSIKAIGKWVYGALQSLVWVKWATGSYLLGEYPPVYDFEFDYDNGILVYASAFFLNSIGAGVRGKWEYS